VVRRGPVGPADGRATRSIDWPPSLTDLQCSGGQPQSTCPWTSRQRSFLSCRACLIAQPCPPAITQAEVREGTLTASEGQPTVAHGPDRVARATAPPGAPPTAARPARKRHVHDSAAYPGAGDAVLHGASRRGRPGFLVGLPD
jgi:hypothetical protein